MITGPWARLAITATLLGLQVITFASEILLYYKDWFGKWRVPLKQILIPLVFLVACTVLVPVTFVDANANPYGLGNKCELPDSDDLDDPDPDLLGQFDADIGGAGVRVAVWVQILSLLLLSILGSFHTRAMGIKEIGAGLVFTHFSLTVAVVVQLGKWRLTTTNAVLGALILDAQNMAVSILLGSKETLAARWQVGIIAVTNAFGLAVIPIIMRRFERNTLEKDPCKCLTFFWWAWVSNCEPDVPGTPDTLEEVIFWIYYACRCIAYIQSTTHGFWNTSTFDRAERSERNLESRLEDRLLSGITYHYHQHRHTDHNGDAAFFREYPATVTLMYWIYGIFAVTSMATTQRTIDRSELHPSEQVSSVGQMISLVIAVSTVARAGWLLWKLFRGKKGKVPPTRWPFQIRPAVLSLWGLRRWDRIRKLLAPESIKLGDLVSDPKDAENTLLSRRNNRALPGGSVATARAGLSVENGVEVEIDFKSKHDPIVQSGSIAHFASKGTYRADRVDVHSFEPTQKYIEDRINDLGDDLGENRRPPQQVSRRIYMIVSQDIAFGLRFKGHDNEGRWVTGELGMRVVAYKVAEIMLPRQKDNNFRIIMPNMRIEE